MPYELEAELLDRL